MTVPAHPTAFGAAFASPRQSAAILRARAGAAGLKLCHVDDADLRAAVLAAQAWSVALDAPTLAPVPGDSASAAALAAALCRAAGHTSFPVPELDTRRVLAELAAAVPTNAVPPREALMREVTAAWDWARSQGASVGEVLAAAHDLAAGWERPQVGAAVTALLRLAESALTP